MKINCWASTFPSLKRRGGCAVKKILRSHLYPRRRARRASATARSRKCGQTCEIFRPERLRRTDHPVCGASVASRLFIYAAATPPFQGGECCSFPIDSHLLLTGRDLLCKAISNKKGGFSPPFVQVVMTRTTALPRRSRYCRAAERSVEQPRAAAEREWLR